MAAYACARVLLAAHRHDHQDVPLHVPESVLIGLHGFHLKVHFASIISKHKQVRTNLARRSSLILQANDLDVLCGNLQRAARPWKSQSSGMASVVQISAALSKFPSKHPPF